MTFDINQFKQAATDLNALESEVHISGNPQGELAGFSFVVKDNVNVEGTLTTASSKLLENYRSVFTATAVSQLLDAGIDIYGKTSMDEFGMGGTNESAKKGPVLNVHDRSRISGGSSGGSAALVAAGVVRGSLGTDTGDSIRKPASYNHIVGLKPTYGRISRYGVIPYASSLDHVGVFTKNVKDAALLLKVMSGRDEKDVTSSTKPAEDYVSFLDQGLMGKRVGILRSVMDTMVHEEALSQFEDFTQQCESLGVEIVEKTMDMNLLRAMFPVYQVIANAEASSNHASLDGIRFGVSKEGESLEAIMIQTRTEGFGYQVRKRLMFGAYSLDHMEVFLKAKRVRRLIVDAYRSLFDDVDVIMVLAIDHGAPLIGHTSEDTMSDHALIAENHMVLDNFSGNPSITIPFGHVEGLPIGLNLAAKPFEESVLLNVAHQFETILEGK